MSATSKCLSKDEIACHPLWTAAVEHAFGHRRPRASKGGLSENAKKAPILPSRTVPPFSSEWGKKSTIQKSVLTVRYDVYPVSLSRAVEAMLLTLGKKEMYVFSCSISGRGKQWGETRTDRGKEVSDKSGLWIIVVRVFFRMSLLLKRTKFPCTHLESWQKCNWFSCAIWMCFPFWQKRTKWLNRHIFIKGRKVWQAYKKDDNPQHLN